MERAGLAESWKQVGRPRLQQGCGTLCVRQCFWCMLHQLERLHVCVVLTAQSRWSGRDAGQNSLASARSPPRAASRRRQPARAWQLRGARRPRSSHVPALAAQERLRLVRWPQAPVARLTRRHCRRRLLALQQRAARLAAVGEPASHACAAGHAPPGTMTGHASQARAPGGGASVAACVCAGGPPEDGPRARACTALILRGCAATGCTIMHDGLVATPTPPAQRMLHVPARPRQTVLCPRLRVRAASKRVWPAAAQGRRTAQLLQGHATQRTCSRAWRYLLRRPQHGGAHEGSGWQGRPHALRCGVQRQRRQRRRACLHLQDRPALGSLQQQAGLTWRAACCIAQVRRQAGPEQL